MTTKDNGSFDADAMRAQAVSQMGQYIEIVDEINRRSHGTWLHPPELRGWHFVRCGKRNSHDAQALAALLRERGWVDAPRSCSMVGIDEVRDSAIYLCCPGDVYQRLQEQKRRIARRRDEMALGSMGGQIQSLASMAGVHVESLDIKHTTGTRKAAVKKRR